MWSATLHACLMVWGLWGSAPYPDHSFLPSDLNLTQGALIFQDFMMQFNKTYRSQEERAHRFKVFVQNLKVSCALQASELGTAQYGVTLFSDLTESEFERMFGIPHPSRPPTLKKSAEPSKEGAKSSCDWRKLGAITAVKVQGKCESCWAFAAVSNIEALWNIHFHSPQNLSVQEVVDCTRCGSGCKGGFPWDAFQTVRDRTGFAKGCYCLLVRCPVLYWCICCLLPSGLTKSEHYPYVGKEQQCRKDRGKPVAWIHDYEFLPRDEKQMAQVVASRGPVTALVNCKPLQLYQGGIIRISSEDCSPQHLDHAVLIVGYGKGKLRSKPWWIIQNSWGEGWGEKGYFRLHRGANTCGIAQYPVTAIVWSSGKKIRVSCPP